MRTHTPELDFVGIGVSRCSTTWIAKCLADYPEVFVPNEKELHYYYNIDRMSRTPLAEYFSDADSSEVWYEFTPQRNKPHGA
jgi:hypothetical protein